MKKHRPRDIPDFSAKRPQRHPGKPDAPKSVVPPPRPQVIKPPATSSKSGRRGQ